MAATVQVEPDVFERAHQDAKKAVATFLPSLMPPSPQPVATPPPPRSDALTEAVRAMSMVRHVEMRAARAARGLPPDPPPPPTPEETFGNQLDAVHTRALSAAIAAHPEEQRARLISEAHDSAVKWIGSHNGKVIVHGKVELAHNPQSAETLAAKIVNATVEEHDQRKQAEAEAAATGEAPGADNPAAPQASAPTATASPATPSVSSQPSVDNSTPSLLAAPQSTPEPASNPIPQNPEIVAPGGSGAIQDQGPAPDVTPAEAQNVGTRKADGHQITQPKNSIEANQKLALEATPELHQSLSAIAAQVPGIQFARLRPQKDEDRLDQKVEDDNDPDTLSDYLGAQVSADSPQAKDQLIDLLRKNYKTIEVDDKFLEGRPDKAHYPSANVQVQLSNGATAEVQIVPKEVQDKTNESHVHYKAGRQAEVDGDNAARDEHWGRAAAIHDEALSAFKARNGLRSQSATSDPHAPLRQSLDAAGVQPIKLGGKLFYPLNSGDGNAVPVPMESDGPQGASVPSPSSGQDEQLSGGIPDGQPQGGDEPQRPSKGQRVTLSDGSEGEVRFVHPNMGIVKVRLDGGGTRIVNPSEITNG